jgi:N-acetylglucosamine-6-sulfatase
MMNGHSIFTYDNPRINGWNGSDCMYSFDLIVKLLHVLIRPVLIDPGTYVFYNSTMARNHEPYRNLPGEYSTDLVANAAVGFLDDAIAASDRPFFLGVAPIAPHSETIVSSPPARFEPPVPAKRHEHLFENVTVPRTPNFNPDTVSQFNLSCASSSHTLHSPEQRHTSRPSANLTKPSLTTTTTGTENVYNLCNQSTS